ncbi:Cell division control protein 1 [Nakaseomyces bracarensis]|uniref:Cell division control protein 1 n=1 Tax=Nakaseomyces bracarensis TaxID=273131 RepID=A0ABR4NQY4_9SACH
MDSLLEKFDRVRADKIEANTVLKRTRVEETFGDNAFALGYTDRDYAPQYHLMYQYRLKVLKERIREECLSKWDSGFRLNGRVVVEKGNVLDIQGKEPCWCIGTIYREMKYKPNVLEEVMNDTYGTVEMIEKSYTDPDGSDEIMLEDESGRVLLVGEYIAKTPFVTGTVIGILGMEADAGTFQVLDVCYPRALPQSPRPPTSKLPDGKTRKIALVSGINISTTAPDRVLKLQLLQEYLMGRLGHEDEIAQIGRLIICGDSVDFNVKRDDPGALANKLDEFGKFLSNTLQSIPIDIMPGAKDPSDRTLPQQPLHKALFRESLSDYFDASNKNILNLVTNPYNFTINGWNMLTTAGQNITDICKYILPFEKDDSQLSSSVSNDERKAENILDLMECTMKWQNIAPTAPDTLWSYPYKNDDPFILKQWPHIYVIGNQPHYGSRNAKLGNKTELLMISLPVFSETGQLVILDLDTMETELVTIDNI